MTEAEDVARLWGTLDALNAELETASDRAVAIVAAAYLDDLLQEILKGAMVRASPKEDKDLFSGSGPLATFSGRTKICFRLGLISEGEHRTLTIIRSIRNDFAHLVSGADFLEESVANRCRSIEISLDMVIPDFIPIPSRANEEPPLPQLKKADGSNPRALFVETVNILSQCLMARSALKTRAKSPLNFEHAHQPGEAMAKLMESRLTKIGALSKRYGELRARLEKIDSQEAAELRDQLGNESDPGVSNEQRTLLEAFGYATSRIKAAHEARRKGFPKKRGSTAKK